MYPDEYVDYLIHFHASRDWFECHEILEEYWKRHPHDPKSRTWVGLIQVAVSLYHHRRGNQSGALKMMSAALRNMDQVHLKELGIDADAFRREAERRLHKLNAGEAAPFADMDIPLADARLIAKCESVCEAKGLNWKQPSDPEDSFLRNKHTLRDRSDVIEARQREANRRHEYKEARG
ncbi:DUF309 domain-containing protein [Paenibacillus ginsengarvi]|uniref:DUF309 domain-containing protein n=1 Tax=Paenibacillus ginsengarvi TaxID=400777 RepID=A0A3B0CMI2_9BACL|nr:DUF309 domain-containing protein [Paenibacillus ginsengarvi]RKN86603.1 DUF309 domain-containing protein [Paenibacillus ginsengarvi]